MPLRTAAKCLRFLYINTKKGIFLEQEQSVMLDLAKGVIILATFLFVTVHVTKLMWMFLKGITCLEGKNANITSTIYVRWFEKKGFLKK